MGFTSIAAADEEAPRKKKHKGNGVDHEALKSETQGFVPSTKEDLKRYAKAGRRAKRLKQEEKEQARATTIGSKQPRLSGDRLRQALVEQKPFRVYGNNLFNKFIEVCKELEIKKPRYLAYMTPERAAQSQFIYELHSALSRMSWHHLTELLHVAVTTTEKPTGVATRTWSEAFGFVRHCLHVALGVYEKKGTLRLTDPSVLDDWPVSERKRKSKEDRSMEEKEELERLAALKASEKDKDEDEDEKDDEDEDEDEDEDDEDEDEDEDDEDEDDDEDDNEPKETVAKGRKRKAKAAKKSKAKDEDDDEDDEDDEDEPKAKKGKKAKKSKAKDDDDDEDEDDEDEPKKGKAKKAKKSKAKDDDDEDDEDEDEPKAKKKAKGKKGFGGKKSKSDDDDADEDEDEVSRKKAKSKKHGKEEAVSKKTKKSKKERAPKKEKVVRVAKVKVEDSTVLSKVKPRPKGGPKTTFLNLIPKKGITFKKLLAAAAEIDISSAKAKKWIQYHIKKGFAEAA